MQCQSATASSGRAHVHARVPRHLDASVPRPVRFQDGHTVKVVTSGEPPQRLSRDLWHSRAPPSLKAITANLNTKTSSNSMSLPDLLHSLRITSTHSTTPTHQEEDINLDTSILSLDQTIPELPTLTTESSVAK